MAPRSCDSSNGFSMKSTAWAWNAARAAGTSPCAVMTTNGIALPSAAHARLELQAAHSGQPQIGDHAAGPARLERLQEAFGVREQPRRVAAQPEHQRKRIADRRIVIDHVDHERRGDRSATGVERQDQVEFAVRRRAGLQRAAVRLGDRPAHRQAESHAGWICRRRTARTARSAPIGPGCRARCRPRRCAGG